MPDKFEPIRRRSAGAVAAISLGLIAGLVQQQPPPDWAVDPLVRPQISDGVLVALQIPAPWLALSPVPLVWVGALTLWMLVLSGALLLRTDRDLRADTQLALSRRAQRVLAQHHAAEERRRRAARPAWLAESRGPATFEMADTRRVEVGDNPKPAEEDSHAVVGTERRAA